MDRGCAHLERVGDLEDVGQARVQLAALDTPDVGAVQAALQRQGFLGDASLAAQLADRFAEGEMAI